jgi:hypothetical protein
MTDVSPAEDRALKFFKEELGRGDDNSSLSRVYRRAFARFIQEVSDAAKECEPHFAYASSRQILAPFILPDTVDPRHKVEAIFANGFDGWKYRITELLFDELPKHGLKIVEDRS